MEENPVKENNLTYITNEKNKTNELIKKGNFEEAEKGYKEIINFINNLKKEELTDDILNQKELILSNLSHTLTKLNRIKEAKKFDIEIIRNLDKKFSKSYARLINAYLEEKNVACARYHYSLMKEYCSKEDIQKFPEVINKIDHEIQEKDQFIQGIEAMKQIFLNK